LSFARSRFFLSLRAERSNPSHRAKKNGLLRRSAPRNKDFAWDGFMRDLIADEKSKKERRR
jgi:hypothetical protein